MGDNCMFTCFYTKRAIEENFDPFGIPYAQTNANFKRVLPLN